MTEDAEPLDDLQPAVLDALFEALHVFRSDLTDLLLEIRAGHSDRAKHLAPVIRDLGHALGTLLKEFEKLEARRSEHAGEDPKSVVDIAEARAEIERRLARLRTAAETDAIS